LILGFSSFHQNFPFLLLLLLSPLSLIIVRVR
jgi:hypothetical protein